MNQSSDHPWPPRFYEAEGEAFAPNSLARSPWDPRAIAGGPVSSLLATCAEDAMLDSEFEVARFQVDILGKVPHTRLVPQITALRDGRQTKLHRITLTADGHAAAQAHILRVRRFDTPVFQPTETYPPPSSVAEQDGLPGARMAGAIKLRPVLGGPGEPGRGIAWLSMDGEVVGGRKPTNFVKACLFADFGNGFGSATNAADWSFANLDISIQFLRMPMGDWFLIDAETHMAGNGHGTAKNTFADERGVFARGFQTVFVAPGHRAASS